ncbi:MAG: hypothetical protein J6M46_04160 [Lachnospiraceae bacterium]|nr:hypothetical protein [Lachnospiraceae bacterium]
MGKEIYHALQDERFQKPFIDIDEIRTRKGPDGEETAYRYMHGGFEGTNVKFSFCFPRRDAYRGRFFQYLSPFPGPDEEMASQDKSGADDKIRFALVNGAYFVETNMGSTTMFGPNGDAQDRWKTSAAAAEYSRVKAMELYNCERPIGIVYGGSGGGYKTMACIENTDAWDGAVPYVIGSPVSLPNTITMHAQGQRVLRNVFPKILDNIDAGGCGNPYEGLNETEAQMLRELTDMGFPPMAWYVEAGGLIDDGSLPVLTPGVKASDPGYFKEFWEVPGYMGADPESSASRDRLQFKAVVKKVHLPGQPESAEQESEIEGRNGVDDAWKKMLTDGKDAWIELEKLPQGEDLYLKGVTLSFLTGEAAGKSLMLDKMVRDEGSEGGYITIGMSFGMSDIAGVLAGIQPGDELMMDNSDYIAIQSYYRHQTPADLSFHAWDQFRNEDGTPALPQRASVMGYHFTGTGTVQDGNNQGKVIVVQALMDESTCPWCADWYRHTVRTAQGSEENFRVYYNQRCMHGDIMEIGNNMVVNYVGVLHQAILDMADWLQEGKEPLQSTRYERVGGQIVEEADPAKRCGMQAGITLTVNGAKCARVKAGGEFVLRAEVTVPENAGEVTGIRYDFNDNWTYPGAKDIFPVEGSFTRTKKDGISGAVSEMVHSFEKPGTYFVSARVSSQRNGDEKDLFTQILNLDRVRVIVE